MEIHIFLICYYKIHLDEISYSIITITEYECIEQLSSHEREF
jgi:hypothetical protein